MINKRGRKKGSKNKYSGEPDNFGFWKITLKNHNEINAFLTRGNKQQKTTIKNILIYLKRTDSEFFEEIDGNKLLEKFE